MNADYYYGLQKFYFDKIISSIIKIGNLNNDSKAILDFGCGTKELQKKLKKEILNYDANKKYSDHDDFINLKFDIVVFNHVLMYMDETEIKSTLDVIKKINKNCKIIIGVGKSTIVNKLASWMTLSFEAHKGEKTTSSQQLKIVFNHTKQIKSKKNIFYMTDVFLLEFK